MDKYKVRITRQARDHLREIRRHIQTVLLSPIAAKNTIAALKEEMKYLDTMPERVHLTPEEPWRSQGIRRLQVKNYFVYFWVDDEMKKVQVIGVIYVHREQTRQLELMEME